LGPRTVAQEEYPILCFERSGAFAVGDFDSVDAIVAQLDHATRWCTVGVVADLFS
jgi:hypothetical protein